MLNVRVSIEVELYTHLQYTCRPQQAQCIYLPFFVCSEWWRRHAVVQL